ncbi:class I adenylate-forming enzyme family protein [Nocardia sp. NPDC057353]|uniref:class I adenylate-forming enzyme family protein n=1 Tax=Nocardia sp. NPDC057353 TaxID=3346104 RepID=UPI00364107F8
MLTVLLREHARTRGNSVFLRSGRRAVGYAELLAAVSLTADRLADAAGLALGFVADDVIEAVTFVLAACEAGAEPCLYPGGDRQAAIDAAGRFGQVVLEFTRTGELAVAGVGSARPAAADPAVLLEPSIAILTSGTTGPPKATRHRVGNLVASATGGGGQAGARWLLAYNINQYAGLQVLIHALATGAELVIPDTIAPAAAMAAMAEHPVTHVSATPTFWRMLLALLPGHAAPVAELRQITIGGEPVADPLLRELRLRFPAARISHVYATSEIGSSVAVSDGRAGLPASILERGAADPVEFRIVAGELQARSRVGMFGYHGAAGVAGDWIATGDLVELRGDRLYFVGRIGSVINVGGVKVYPLPVEDAIGAVPGVELVRVYGRPNPVTGRIVAAEVVAARDHDPAALRRAVTAACAVLPEAARPRLVKIVDSLSIVQNKMDRRNK